MNKRYLGHRFKYSPDLFSAECYVSNEVQAAYLCLKCNCRMMFLINHNKYLMIYGKEENTEWINLISCDEMIIKGIIE